MMIIIDNDKSSKKTLTAISRSQTAEKRKRNIRIDGRTDGQTHPLIESLRCEEKGKIYGRIEVASLVAQTCSSFFIFHPHLTVERLRLFSSCLQFQRCYPTPRPSPFLLCPLVPSPHPNWHPPTSSVLILSQGTIIPPTIYRLDTCFISQQQ